MGLRKVKRTLNSFPRTLSAVGISISRLSMIPRFYQGFWRQGDCGRILPPKDPTKRVLRSRFRESVEILIHTR